MKKVVLLACVMVVSGFASSCSSIVTRLNGAIEVYNNSCTNKRYDFSTMGKPRISEFQCKEQEELIQRLRNELDYCREKRDDDIVNRFNSIYR